MPNWSYSSLNPCVTSQVGFKTFLSFVGEAQPHCRNQRLDCLALPGAESSPSPWTCYGSAQGTWAPPEVLEIRVPAAGLFLLQLCHLCCTYTSFGGHELGFKPAAFPLQLINSKARQDFHRYQVTQSGEKAGSFPSSTGARADTEVA